MSLDLSDHRLEPMAMHISRKLTIALIFAFSLVALKSQAPPTASSYGSAETQVRGYWADPSTGLMWAGKDNGKDVKWKNAVKYCRDLRLAGYSDWRLATLGELEGIYDKNGKAPGLSEPPGKIQWAFHVAREGQLVLDRVINGAAPREMDDRGILRGMCGNSISTTGGLFNGDGGHVLYSNKRALCVRGAGK